MTFWDYALAATIVFVWPVVQHVSEQALLRRMERGEPHNRVLSYWLSIGVQAGMAVMVALIWIVYGRPFSAIGFNLYAYAIEMAVVMGAVLVATSIYRFWRPYSQKGLRNIKASISASPTRMAFFPANQREHRLHLLFFAVSAVATEVYYRGFLTWLLWKWVSFEMAFFLALVPYAVWITLKYRRSTALIGAVYLPGCCALLYYSSGSLLPGIIFHLWANLFFAGVSWRAMQLPDVEAEAG